MDGQKKKHTTPGEVSFSSYLSTAEEIFVHKFAEPGIKHPQVAIGRLQRNKSPVGEIRVFGAEKHFDTKLGDINDDEDDRQRQMGSRWRPGTPSASSEASWSSQSVLLRSFMRDRSLNKEKRVDGRSFFSNLSCTGSCSNGKSVHVDQINVDRGRVHAKEVRRKLIQVKDVFHQRSVRSNREACFPKLETQFDDPRKSLEVFGSTAMKKGDVTKNLERKFSMLTWDAIPNAPTAPRSSRANDDVESNCSSDLFEIDNIYGDALASDGKSSCMSPYAPSETSVKWSVVTAGAADCSFVSDYDKRKSKTVSRVANTTKEAQRSRSGGILGCRSHKAAMIAETAHTRKEKMKSPNTIDLNKLFP
ncbi:S-adenosyl-L-methionine-dependent methyltransferases superfamily protein [Hibiscus syriacus]|uniref:S-adenosyl-L-methionine-dependent methyltransferases superfamily protein n=1 Tax=Hibiscus syriacus TaxID=106335 RepID=A0A6A2Y4H3_HIBSY|nr:protein PHYTOCHROME KINASE SUBSTRATE 3-like [Hibiscus syriacus]KAE8670766.1 S-adenosyl-L-methionine-dependent methyltransferases superfamily protein [Hibiscus syriacus]